MDAVAEKTYRAIRKQYPTHPARLALRDAKLESKLQVAEREDRIRFRWVWDEGFDLGNYSDNEEMIEETRTKLAAGEWEVLGCIVEVPKTCPHCAQPIEDEWTDDTTPSLWGIVVDLGPDGRAYRRDIERDLASEAGVI